MAKKVVKKVEESNEVESAKVEKKVSQPKEKSLVEQLPEGVEFSQVGQDSILTYGNRRIRVNGKLADRKEHLASVFINGK
jgi:hypothetical protein